MAWSYKSHRKRHTEYHGPMYGNGAVVIFTSEANLGASFAIASIGDDTLHCLSS